MIDGKDLLSGLLKTAQLEQYYIRCMLKLPMDPVLRETLSGHLHEYDAIETDVRILAVQRGWDVQEPDPAFRIITGLLLRCRGFKKDARSAIAGYMILHYTKSMIHIRKSMHAFTGKDPALRILCRKLLDCETAAIRQLQRFL